MGFTTDPENVLWLQLLIHALVRADSDHVPFEALSVLRTTLLRGLVAGKIETFLLCL